MSQPNNQEISRTFIIGDEWFFYKIYLGPKTADKVLVEVVKPAVEKFLQTKSIDYWFFIRYADPQNHIRVRFHLPKDGVIPEILQTMNQLLKPLVGQGLIWKVQTDTYQRELERYQPEIIAEAEELFFYDSTLMVKMLSLIEGDEGEHFRWLFAVRAVDTLLDDFHYGEKEKLELMTILKENYGREFGLNKDLKKQLEQKYRTDKPLITTVLDRQEDEKSEMKPLFDLLQQRSQSIGETAKKIIGYCQSRPEEKKLNELMASYLHMMINRLFKTKQRLHELVLYDFLERHYTSSLARKKYEKKEDTPPDKPSSTPGGSEPPSAQD